MGPENCKSCIYLSIEFANRIYRNSTNNNFEMCSNVELQNCRDVEMCKCVDEKVLIIHVSAIFENYHVC